MPPAPSPNAPGHSAIAYANALVPEAQKLSVKVRHHTSLFETKAKGEVQLAKLKAAIAAAKQAATPKTA
jgi:hypothetical protein